MATASELTDRLRALRRPAVPRRRWPRATLVGGVAGGLCAIGFAAGGEALHRGPPQGSAAWLRGQRLLERPAPALAAADDARQRGDLLRAEWLLGEIALRHPVIGDHADLMGAQVTIALQRPAEAVALLERALEAYPESPLLADFFAALGHARARNGDEPGARLAWRNALDRSDDEEFRAGLLLATGASEERAGDAAAAAQTYTILWYLYPLSEQAALAEGRLAELEPPLGRRRDGSTWRRRGDSLFRKRRNEAALAAYDVALADGLPTLEAGRVRKRRAQTLFRMRLYPEAAGAFLALPQVDDVPIWHARSLARAGRVPEAIKAFEKLARQRDGNVALRARFLAALLLDGRGEFARARRYLESLSSNGSRSSVGRASLWRLAWGAYREDRYADAISFLDPLIAAERDPISQLRSRYWRARCIASLGRTADNREGSAPGNPRLADFEFGEFDDDSKAAARAEFQAIADEYPLSYYGWRARLQLPADSPLRGDPAGTDMFREVLSDTERRKLPPRAFTRARILLEAGLDDRAREELQAASRSVGGLSDRLELAQLLSSAGSYRAAQRLVVDPYKETLARGPTATLEQLWWHAWPAAYLDLVEQATREPGSVAPALVLSIMREESGFLPRVVSPVGARGLLQIMETTGERLARDVGHENFSADDLFEPMINIRLGSHYLSELSRQFDGRLSAAIASYNAGPVAVSGWLEERPDDDDAEWVEAIPYDQTRSYVKRVLRSLQAYTLLY